MENNSSLQADEVQALAAIYADDWIVEDEEHHIYSITIQDKSKDKSVYLQITMPPEYPQKSPPLYQISAPWLKRSHKLELSSMLEDIYCENAGQNIIFLWIEKVREYVANQENVPTQENTEIESPEIESVEVASFSNIFHDEITIYHGDPITFRKSTFQAHLAPVVTKDQVALVLNKLLENRKIASATHNIHAYRICDEEDKVVYQDCDDDGEAQAGVRLMHLLQILRVKNAMVVVSRWFGGVLLGPDRFKYINNAARNVLGEHGYMKTSSGMQDDSKNDSKGKKKKK